MSWGCVASSGLRNGLRTHTRSDHGKAAGVADIHKHFRTGFRASKYFIMARLNTNRWSCGQFVIPITPAMVTTTRASVFRFSEVGFRQTRLDDPLVMVVVVVVVVTMMLEGNIFSDLNGVVVIINLDRGRFLGLLLMPLCIIGFDS